MGVAGSPFSTRLRMGWEECSRAPPGPAERPRIHGRFSSRRSSRSWHRPCYRSRVEGDMAEMLACGSERQWTRRPEDRRQGVHALVRALAEHLIAGNPEVRLQALLEARLARLVGAARARVVPARPASPASAPKGIPRPWASAAIPGPDHSQPLALELDGNGRSPDAWDRQVIETAAHLAALALAADRGRTADGRAGHDRRRTAHRLERGDAGAARAHRARGGRRFHRPHRRRERHRQGTGRAPDPRPQPAPLGAVRRGELRRAGRDAARGRAVRHRGAHRHRRPRPSRQVRARRRRHPVPRRGRRPVARGAGQAAACHPGAGGRTSRRARHAAAQRAHRRRHQHAHWRRWSSAGCSGPTSTTG